MSKKSTMPPPRPPAPKSGGSSGMSFSFKALEEGDDEDEELTILDGKFDRQVSHEKEKHAREIERERSVTKHPVEKLQTVGEEKPLARSQNSFDKIKDLTGKLQDTISKKIDELTDTPTKSEPIKINEHVQARNLNGDIYRNSEKTDVKELDNVEDGTGRIASSYNETHYFEMTDRAEKVEEVKSEDTDDLNLIDEYFIPESGEDFSDLPGVVPMVRQRKKFPFKKVKPVIPPAPISMSKLSKDLKEDPVKTVRPDNKVEKNETVDNLANNVAVIAKDKVNTVVNLAGRNIPVWKLVCGVCLLLIYWIVPLPSYFNGLIAGLILSSAGWALYLWVMQPPKPREVIPELPLDKLPPMPVPEMKEPKGEDGCYKVHVLY